MAFILGIGLVSLYLAVHVCCMYVVMCSQRTHNIVECRSRDCIHFVSLEMRFGSASTASNALLPSEGAHHPPRKTVQFCYAYHDANPYTTVKELCAVPYTMPGCVVCNRSPNNRHAVPSSIEDHTRRDVCES
ncbi:hypothetical protein CALCODRAFT_272930 [Calocera cornea HHB12733]|uniref:Secreted protein n=1 Tax=Calocera cornea HHB12733 TaxID=1353952 RepID=A0A165G6Q2_9BASI|nr:hypothetical protein CALCODRAFT_272930 [Calocera cornea HHB12733]